MTKKLTISTIKKLKNERKLTMITAYDALFGKLFNNTADIILVGDSLNMSFGGKADTLSITLDQMIYHTQAVSNGATDTFLITDMPFGTYITKEVALESALKVYRQSSADAVKIEGGADKADTVKYLVDNGIAVCGHIGLLPQSVRSEGGYKVKGKDEQSAKSLLQDAKEIEKAGAFCIVIEGVKADVAKIICKSVSIPVIGIGAGNALDGQVLVFSDMLGLFEDFTPKFVKKYLDGAALVKNAVRNYKKEVESGEFPDEIHTY